MPQPQLLQSRSQSQTHQTTHSCHRPPHPSTIHSTGSPHQQQCPRSRPRDRQHQSHTLPRSRHPMKAAGQYPMSLQRPPQMTHAQCDHPQTHQSWTPQTPRHQQSNQQTLSGNRANQSRPSTRAETPQHSQTHDHSQGSHSRLRTQTQTLQHSQPRPEWTSSRTRQRTQRHDRQHAQQPRR